MPPNDNEDKNYQGLTKAAILLIALGPDYSTKIFKHLDEDQIEKLTLEIANLKNVDSETQRKVVKEFYEYASAKTFISKGGIEYAKELLVKALGPEKALEIINKLTATLQVRPFDFLKKTDPSQLLNTLQSEHPQTIALILAYLDPQQAAMIISSLPENMQSDVAKRIALMDRTSPDVIKEVEKILEKKMSSFVSQDYTKIGGVDSIVELLNNVDRGTSKRIMETLEEDNPELAEEIKKQMFVFEDILLLDDRSVQLVLREVDMHDVALALKGVADEVKEKILNNLSKRGRGMLEEEIEFLGPVRVKDVEEAQQKLVAIMRRLEESGEIIISRGGGEELIV